MTHLDQLHPGAVVRLKNHPGRTYRILRDGTGTFYGPSGLWVECVQYGADPFPVGREAVESVVRAAEKPAAPCYREGAAGV